MPIDPDKPWMVPIQYDEPRQVPDVALESDPEPEEGLERIPRASSSRDAVKPVGGASKDTAPLRYKRGNPNEVFGLDDDDEPGGEDEVQVEEDPPAF